MYTFEREGVTIIFIGPNKIALIWDCLVAAADHPLLRLRECNGLSPSGLSLGRYEFMVFV
jgi:hypothetical protein